VLEGVDLQKDRAIDADILVEQISLRERFEEATHVAGEQGRQQVEQLLAYLKQQMAVVSSEFSAASSEFFKQGSGQGSGQDSGQYRATALQALKQLLSKMMFLNKLIADVELFIETLD
jgi:uncharacterized protein involved in exopolysaccharide biosynthesis